MLLSPCCFVLLCFLNILNILSLSLIFTILITICLLSVLLGLILLDAFCAPESRSVYFSARVSEVFNCYVFK